MIAERYYKVVALLIDRWQAERMETESRDFFASYLRQVVTLVGLAPRLLQCVFFPRDLLKPSLDGRSYLSVAGSHQQVRLCSHPGGFKSTSLLVGPFKLGCWVQLMTNDFNVVLHPLGRFIWGPQLNLVETFVKSP